MRSPAAGTHRSDSRGGSVLPSERCRNPVPSGVGGCQHMELECQLASHGVNCGTAKADQSKEAVALEAGAADWRPLLQIALDDDFGTMWGDAGNIYFWVQESEARAA